MKIGVIGAGTMGHGIAQISAMAGHDVVLRDVERDRVDAGLASIRDTLQEGVERGKIDPERVEPTLSRIHGTTSLRTAVEDVALVIEAVPEKLKLKHEVLREVQADSTGDPVIASNTSSLSLTEIASDLDTPEKVIGAHFFNPPHIMELVEIVLAEQTGDDTLEFTRSFVEGIDRTPIVIKDVPGFASSRLGVALGVEAIRMVERGVGSPRDIDLAMELGYNHPMGPLHLTDVVGLDVRLDILNNLHDELGERFRPPQLLKRLVRAGYLGKKAGVGFYNWEDDERAGVNETLDG